MRDRYIVGEQLQESSGTRVFRAKTQDGTPVVLKCSRTERTTPQEAGRLHHEYAVLCDLGPLPGLVALQGLETINGTLTLVLQDPGASSLDRVLAQRSSLPVGVVLRLGLQAARILDAVHQAGILHKDVKPENLLVDADLERLWLIDFSIASRLAFEATSALMPEALEGSLAYISPEQTGRTARSLDSRTDLYSLGITLFEMLAGRCPFQQSDPLALLHAHLAHPPPPLESLAPAVPSTVSRIVERLLAKDPDKRYQTAKGLAFDLERALEQWTQHGHIEPFPLGQKDFSQKLHLPQILLGRDQATEVLKSAFRRAAQGAVELLLVGGPSGIGKTTLVRSVYREIARQGQGQLLSGKHDQLAQSEPYSALSQAIAELMGQIAASPKPQFDSWKQRILKKVGAPTRVLADLFPEIRWVVEELPEVPPVSAEMAANRLRMAWIDFVEVVRDHSPPLVLFLDDLQWADPASLAVLKTLLTDIGRKQLLIVAAYRDSETPPEHPLWKLVEEVEPSGVHTTRLSVGPLDAAMVQQWLAATLCSTPDQVEPLARVLHRKTAGNPFFLGQLLLDQYRAKRVQRDLDSGQWQWDLASIDSAVVTDNVAELLSRKVQELPAATQQLLGHAACAGHVFTLEELAVLSGLPAGAVAQGLWPALRAGLLLPADRQYRDAQALAQSAAWEVQNARYQFLHDRVQQASYERIAPNERARTHWVVGERLRAHYQQHGGRDKDLLEYTRQLNLGASVLQTDAERLELAQENLKAARAAKNNSVFRLQATLVETAQALLGSAAWETQPALSAELELEWMEAAYLLREFDAVHARALQFLQRPLPPAMRLAAQELRVRTYAAAGDFGGGEALGLQALEEQGIRYPATNEECIAATLAALKECDAWFDGHPEGFEDFPLDTRPDRLLVEALQVWMPMCSAVGPRPGLAAIVGLRNVQHMIEHHAVTSVSPFILGGLAQLSFAFFGNYRTSTRWAEQSLRVAKRVGSPFLPECFYFRGVYGCYEQPIAQSHAYFQAGLQEAITAGSFHGTAFNLIAELYYVGIWGGHPLEEIEEQVRAQREILAKKGDAHGQHAHKLATDLVAFLREPLQGRPPEDDAWQPFHSSAFLALGNGTMAEFARVLEAGVFLMLGAPQRALARAEEAARFAAMAYGVPLVTDIPLWQGVAAAQCWSTALPPAEQERLQNLLAHGIERLRYFSQGCAANFGHKLRLLEAEQARIEGRLADALLAYDEAIEQAQDQGWLHIEALSTQLCAEFHLAAGRTRLGRQYLEQACNAYERWGARRIVHYLRKHYYGLLPTAAPVPAALLSSAAAAPAAEAPFGSPARPWSTAQTMTSRRSSTTHSTSEGHATLDLGTAIRSAQTLSSELEPARVVSQLMQLVLESAGAQRAALLLGAADSLNLVAKLDLSLPEPVETGLSMPLADCQLATAAMVGLVARSQQPLLLPDARQDERFRDDAQLAAANTRAVLLVPLLRQGRLLGVLSLEHQEPAAFPAHRVALVSVLAAQASIALENARLYKDLQQASQELRQANEGLERKVAARTIELQKALSELWSEMDLATKIQTVLLPPDGIYGHYELAAQMRPAEQVGGDYYDVLQRGAETWVLIGDVAGHGVSAGLIMMMVQTAVRTVLQSAGGDGTLTPAKLLAQVNASVFANLEKIGKGQYMTITALRICQDRVQFAGLHQDMLVYRGAAQKVERIETDGLWLGVTEEIGEVLSEKTLYLAPEDWLVLLTDGVLEAKTAEGAMLGLESFMGMMQSAAAQAGSSRALVDSLFESLSGLHKPDDATLLALRFLPSS